MSPQSLSATQIVPAAQFSARGLFPWPNSARRKEGEKGEAKQLPPQSSLAEAPGLTEEDGGVLRTSRLPFK